MGAPETAWGGVRERYGEPRLHLHSGPMAAVRTSAQALGCTAAHLVQRRPVRSQRCVRTKMAT